MLFLLYSLGYCILCKQKKEIKKRESRSLMLLPPTSIHRKGSGYRGRYWKVDSPIAQLVRALH